MCAPGGVMSVATANALKLRWPAVWQELSVSDRPFFIHFWPRTEDGESAAVWNGVSMFAGMRYIQELTVNVGVETALCMAQWIPLVRLPLPLLCLVTYQHYMPKSPSPKHKE